MAGLPATGTTAVKVGRAIKTGEGMTGDRIMVPRMDMGRKVDMADKGK
jgi:hypothetical protein